MLCVDDRVVLSDGMDTGLSGGEAHTVLATPCVNEIVGVEVGKFDWFGISSPNCGGGCDERSERNRTSALKTKIAMFR